MQHQDAVDTPPPALLQNFFGGILAAHRGLPGRTVASDTIENSYVTFILYCNPFVALDADTTSLREAFRTPPRSGGKSFNTWALFELIRRLERKEIKTWAELALRLGVEPPDADKGQSSQKVQQYAVRLKRWMHSMRLDGFFDYLLGNQHTYFTHIPLSATPTFRDGVAPEDDMALRCLMPEIKPRRGRRQSETEKPGEVPRKRLRLNDAAVSSPSHTSAANIPGQWFTQQYSEIANVDQVNTNAFSAQNTPEGSTWNNAASDGSRTADHWSGVITSKQEAWAETPTKVKSDVGTSRIKSSERHGAKVVSSAWRPSGVVTGKPRGRPPLRKVNIDQVQTLDNNDTLPGESSPSLSQVASAAWEHATPTLPMSTSQTGAANTTSNANVGVDVSSGYAEQGSTSRDYGLGRASSPNVRRSFSMSAHNTDDSQLALAPNAHVFPRFGSAQPSRLAMAPTQYGQTSGYAIDVLYTAQQSMPLDRRNFQHSTSWPQARSTTTPASLPVTARDSNTLLSRQASGVRFKDQTNRANRKELENHFVSQIVDADWFDEAGTSMIPCSVNEATAISQQIIETVMKGSSSNQTFLINLAVLTSGRILKSTDKMRIIKTTKEGSSTSHYACHFQMQLGDIKSSFLVNETVAHDRWQAGEETMVGGWQSSQNQATSSAKQYKSAETDDAQPASYWRRKYDELLEFAAGQTETIQSLQAEVARLHSGGHVGFSEA